MRDTKGLGSLLGLGIINGCPNGMGAASEVVGKHAMEKGRGTNPPIFKFEIIQYGFLCCKAVKPGHTFVQVVVGVSLNGYL
jgi:hypothetical protein